MIIFGNRAHYSAIGGVENSIRSMLGVLSEQQQQAILVCREPLMHESIDSASLELPSGVELASYRDEYHQNLLRRLFFLRHGGEALPDVYRDLFARFPDAILIVRHHTHVLAARRAGFMDIRYLVPSLTVNQLREDLSGASIFKKLNTMVHIMVDGWLQSKSLSMASLFVFSVSMQEQVRQRLRGRFKGNPIAIVKPGVDNSRFKVAGNDEKHHLRLRLGLPLEKKLFLFVGRFVQAKGLDYLLDAFAKLPLDCSIVLVGEGEREANIRDRILSLGIKGRALLVGRTSRVEDFYRASDVFVMSSTYEPFGQTILEAAACEMKMAAYGPDSGVATATHELGLDHLISYANKLDIESLADAMSKAMDSVKERESDPKGKSMSQLYSWPTLLNHLTQ